MCQSSSELILAIVIIGRYMYGYNNIATVGYASGILGKGGTTFSSEMQTIYTSITFCWFHSLIPFTSAKIPNL